MPYKNLPESEWGRMDRCVDEVMAKGHDKPSAIAICYTSITGKEYQATPKGDVPGHEFHGNQYSAGQAIRVTGSVGGEFTGDSPAKIITSHSNANKVTHVDKRGRMYEGAVSHIPTATVEIDRSKRGLAPLRFEAYHYQIKSESTKKEVSGVPTETPAHGPGGMLSQPGLRGTTKRDYRKRGKAMKRTEKATAEINDLPDSAFLHVESGGKKDDEGKTEPRSLRHLPYKTAGGEIDLPKLRNALSRLGQSDTGESGGDKWLTASLRKSLTSEAQGILEKNTDAESAKKEAHDLLAAYREIKATGKEFEPYDAMCEAWDICEAAQVLISLAQLAYGEAGEDEPEAEADVADIAELMRGVMDFIDGEIDEMLGKGESDTAAETMMKERKPSILQRFVNTLKAGARNSKSDQEHLQQAHDHLIQAGAMCNTEKQADGHYRWTIAATGAYQDRDGEWVTQKALEKWLPTFTRKELAPTLIADIPTRFNGESLPLRWWHVEEPIIASRSKGWGVDLGVCDFAAMHGKSLIMSGLYDDDSIGASMKEKGDDLGASINFFHPVAQPGKSGEYHDIDIFSVSLLPEARASYPLTTQLTAKEHTDMDKQKMKELENRIGSEAVNSLLAKVTDKEKAAELAGNTPKEKVVEKSSEPGAVEKEIAAMHKELSDIKSILDRSDAARAKSVDDQKAAVKALEDKFATAQKELKEAQAKLNELTADVPRGVRAMVEGYRASSKGRSLTAEEVTAKGFVPAEPEANPLLGLVDRLDGKQR